MPGDQHEREAEQGIGERKQEQGALGRCSLLGESQYRRRQQKPDGQRTTPTKPNAKILASQIEGEQRQQCSAKPQVEIFPLRNPELVSEQGK